MTPLGILGPVHLVAAVVGLSLLTASLIRLYRSEDGVPTRRLASAGGLFMAIPFALGWAMYPTYRTQIKPGLLTEHPGLVTAFESKEHLAAMGLCCVLGGVGALIAPEGLGAGRSLLTTGWMLCVIAAGIGVAVTWVPSL